jgi:serine/threonine protein kinase
MCPRQFGPYLLEEVLGVGGMGEVWRARDTRRERLVALTLLPENLNGDPEFASRFRRESHVAARLREPHVIPIHDYGEIDGRRARAAEHESGVLSVLALDDGGRVLEEIPVGVAPHSVALSPDGSRVAVVSYGSEIRLVDTATDAVLDTGPWA